MDSLETLSLSLIKKHEGYKSEPYLDSLGIVTIGIGRNLEAHPLRDEDIQTIKRHASTEKDPFLKWHEEFTLKEMGVKIALLKERLPFFEELSLNRQAVLVDMIYCLGEKLFSFERMLSHLKNKDFSSAAKSLMESAFAKQTGIRAKELSQMMEVG